MEETPFFVETLCVGPFAMNCSLLVCLETREAALVDPGDEAPRLLEAVERHGATVTSILLTHGHLDHVGVTAAVKTALGAPLHMHPAERPLYEQAPMQARFFGLPPLAPLPPADVFVEDGQTVCVGALELLVLHAPGHSVGSVCYYLAGAPGVVFAGDVLFAGGVGRTDLFGGSYPTLMRSIGQKLLSLPDSTRVLSGHGPETTIGRERTSNPFRRDFGPRASSRP